MLLKLVSSCFFSSFLEGKEVFSTFKTRTAFAIRQINHLVSYTGFLSHNLPKPIKCNIGSLSFVKQPLVHPQKNLSLSMHSLTKELLTHKTSVVQINGQVRKRADVEKKKKDIPENCFSNDFPRLRELAAGECCTDCSSTASGFPTASVIPCFGATWSPSG